MDPRRFKEAYARLKALDEHTHKVRARGSSTMMRGSVEQLEDRLRDLASYTVELREIVDDLFVAIASEPTPAAPQPAAPPPAPQRPPG